jgi:hypothetical protein
MPAYHQLGRSREASACPKVIFGPGPSNTTNATQSRPTSPSFSPPSPSPDGSSDKPDGPPRNSSPHRAATTPLTSKPETDRHRRGHRPRQRRPEAARPGLAYPGSGKTPAMITTGLPAPHATGVPRSTVLMLVDRNELEGQLRVANDVEAHRATDYRKLGIRSRTQLA